MNKKLTLNGDCIVRQLDSDGLIVVGYCKACVSLNTLAYTFNLNTELYECDTDPAVTMTVDEYNKAIEQEALANQPPSEMEIMGQQITALMIENVKLNQKVTVLEAGGDANVSVA